MSGEVPFPDFSLHPPDDPAPRPFVHPLTGELLAGTDEDLLLADRETRDEISRLYGVLNPLQEEIAKIKGQVKVPARRYRTETQEKAVRCPACGHRYEEVG